jgi:hypothetical protein
MKIVRKDSPMKMSLNYISRLRSLIIVFLVALCLPTIAQNQHVSQNEQILPPIEEKFQEATDLVSPWRSSGCNPLAAEFREPNCYFVKTDVWRKSDVLMLYNEDGSIWYRFSIDFQSPDYFLDDKKMGFIPFATPYGNSGTPHIVLLRMVAESPHWYEVEVNEQTRATKFVLKSDPMWGTTKWSYWLYESGLLRLGGKQALRDKPNGKIIEETANFSFDKVKALKVEGDWVYVQGFLNPNRYFGWVRWRKGRNILVGSLYNNAKVPEIEINVEDK